MISNNPLFLHNQDHQAKHSDILAAARSAPVKSPPIWWRTCAFDNFGGVAYERPAPSAPVSIFTKDEAIIYGLVKSDLNQMFKSLDQLLKSYGMADAPIARANAAVASMPGQWISMLQWADNYGAAQDRADAVANDLGQLLDRYGMADAPIGYEQAQARADAAVAKMRADAIRTQERRAVIAQMRALRGQR